MEQSFVAQFFSFSSLCGRFQEHWCLETARETSLAPVEKVTIVGTEFSLHFDMLLDVGLTIFPQRCLLASEQPTPSFLHMPIFVRDLMPSLVEVAVLGPPSQLEVEHMVAGMEGL